MALIKCSECGKEISDRAKECPNCGCPIDTNPEYVSDNAETMTDHAEQTESGVEEQVNSGTQEQFDVPIKEEVNVAIKDETKQEGITISPKTLKVGIGCIAGVAILLVLFIVVVPGMKESKQKGEKYQKAIEMMEKQQYVDAAAAFEMLDDYKDSKEKTAEANQKLLELIEQQRAEYQKHFVSAAAQCYVLGELAYTRCSTISKAWDAAINDKYNEDFNDDVQELLSRWEIKGLTEKTDNLLKSLETEMKTLKKPDSDWEQAYDLMIRFYSVANKMYTQSTNPTGSLLTYNSTIKDYYSEFDSLYQEIIVVVPEVTDAEEDVVDQL